MRTTSRVGMVVVVAFATLVATAGPAAAACIGGAFAPEHEYEVDYGETRTVLPEPDGLLIGAEPTGNMLVDTENSDLWSVYDADIKYINQLGGSAGGRQGGFVYTPTDDTFSGIDMFDYWIIEKNCSSDNADWDFNTVTVIVRPVLANDSYNMVMGTTLSVSSENGPLANDKGHDPASFWVPANATAAGGTLDVSLDGDGAFEYTPPTPTFTGVDTFEYTIDDLNFDYSYTATVTINVAADTTPPGVPTSVSTTPGNGSAVVKWGAAPGNGNPIVEYRVIRQPGNEIKTLAGDETSTTFTSLSNGTKYTFYVRATSLAGNGPTVSKSATPRTVPGKPTGVKGQASGTTITVTWKRPATNGASLTGSTVTASNGKVVSVSGDTNRATFSGMKPGSYTFRAKSKNVVGTGLSSSPSPSTIVAQQLPTYTARFTTAEYRYLQKTAAHFGIPVSEVGKTGVAVIRYILAIAPHPPTRAAARPQNSGPIATTAKYSVAGNAATMMPVSRYLVLNGNDTLKVGAALMQYFAALRGVR